MSLRRKVPIAACVQFCWLYCQYMEPSTNILQTCPPRLRLEAAILNTLPKAERNFILLAAITAGLSLLYAVQYLFGGPTGPKVAVEINDMALSPNGPFVAAGTQDGTVRLWDIPDKRDASGINPPSGCRFHPRCPCATEICSREEPSLPLKGEE